MEDLGRAWYSREFELAFLKKKGDEFQDFFSEIMETRYPSDFIRVRPWGRQGDRKNDGYLKSKRILFQVYGPNEMEASQAIKKIDEDFHGALPYWREHFDAWVFVHNSRGGLGPEIVKKLLDLGTQHADLKIEHWGYQELWQEVAALPDEGMSTLLGPAPSSRSMLSVGFNELRIVFETVSQAHPVPEANVRPVSPKKLEFNALSTNVEILLKAGMSKADHVRRFFDQWHDPTYGDRMAEQFRQKYYALRDAHLPPDEIFTELQVWAGGTDDRSPRHQCAILAVLAYFFEACEIFESPPVQV